MDFSDGQGLMKKPYCHYEKFEGKEPDVLHGSPF
jgi:hypothetical protein